MTITETFVGKKCGRLLILGVERVNGELAFQTLCDCGTISVKNAANVRHRRTVSCGCRLRETWSARDKGYESNSSRTYVSWENMQNRCNPLNVQHVATYDGIVVCERWSGVDGFKHFLEDMGARPDGKTLDRKDNDLNYEPGNCRWATHKEQQNNRRVTVRLPSGETMGQYAARVGLSYMQAWHRFRRGQLSFVE